MYISAGEPIIAVSVEVCEREEVTGGGRRGEERRVRRDLVTVSRADGTPRLNLTDAPASNGKVYYCL